MTSRNHCVAGRSAIVRAARWWRHPVAAWLAYGGFTMLASAADEPRLIRVQLAGHPIAEAAQRMVAVPLIERLTVPEARTKLAQSGLLLGNFESVSPDENAEIVMTQQPLPGQPARPNSSVTVTVRPVRQTATSGGQGSQAQQPANVASAPSVNQTPGDTVASVSTGKKRGNGNAAGSGYRPPQTGPATQPGDRGGDDSGGDGQRSFWQQHPVGAPLGGLAILGAALAIVRRIWPKPTPTIVVRFTHRPGTRVVRSRSTRAVSPSVKVKLKLNSVQPAVAVRFTGITDPARSRSR